MDNSKLGFNIINNELTWKLPWRGIQFDADIPHVQNQLESEITEKHPLWDTKPIAIGRRVDCDDVLAKLNNGTFASDPAANAISLEVRLILFPRSAILYISIG